MLAVLLLSASPLACDRSTVDTRQKGRMEEQAVLVHLKLSNDGTGTRGEVEAIHALSDRLEARILEAGAGEFDGDEFGQGECTLYMYGPDADALFRVIEPELRASPLSRGGSVTKRYGAADDPSAREVRVSLDAGL